MPTPSRLRPPPPAPRRDPAAGPRPPRGTSAARERDALRTLLTSIGRDTELTPLLDRLLEEARARVGADYGGIALLTDDGRALRVAVSCGLATSLVGAELPADDGFAGVVLRTRAPLRLRRYADARAEVTHPEFRDDAVVGIPICWHDALLGVLSLARRPAGHGDRRAARAFTAREAAALRRFADDAAVGVANARRFAAERRRAERLALIAHVGRLVTADLHLDDLLARAADAIHELLGYENVAVALLAPGDGPGAPDVLDLRHFGGAYKRNIGGAHRIPVTEGLMGAAARTREAILVNDAAADPRYLPTPGAAARHAELVLPLLLGTEVLGVLNVERAAPFGGDDVEHLRIVADQLAVAVENARLHEAARQAAVLEERHRLARELHDSVTQQLFTAAMVAQGVDTAYARDPAEGARRARMLVDLTRGALAEMRTLLAELRPAAPGAGAAPPPPDAGLARLRAAGAEAADETGLAAALRAHVDTHLPPTLVGDLCVAVDVGAYRPQAAAVEEALYRVAREALHNVVKHARARRAVVRLAADDRAVRLTVEDDGAGFAAPPAGAPPRGSRRRGGGLGLVSMQERAAQLGGVVRVTSAPGAGTRVVAELPLAPEVPP